MKRKFFAAFLSLCMVMSLVPMAALAAETGETVVAKVGEAEYTSLSEAVNNAPSGATIVVQTNVDISETGLTIPVDKSLTLDINGKEIKAANTQVGRITVYGHLTIKDSTDTDQDGADCGKIYTETDYNGPTTGYSVIGIVGENASATMESGYIYAVRADASNKGQFGVGVDQGGDFTMTGGKIEAGWYAVSGNGNNSTQNSEISITGGELISTADYAIYLPHSGVTNISGGVIYGAAGGISIQRNVLNISGDVLITSKGTGNTGNWGDGTGGQGCAAVNVNARYGDCDVNISGGTLTAENDAIVLATGATHSTDVSVTGGSFSGDVTEYFPEGAILTQDTDGKVIPNANAEESAVAEVNGVPYTSLQSALNMARDGDTVTLLKDETLNATITVDKTVTIDLNQRTVTGDAVRAFHVTSGTLTLTGTGTVTSTEMQDPNSSVIRVGNNGTASTSPAGLVVGENVVIKAPGTYGISVFGNATEETLTVNGTVTATGPAPAISGNGMYDGTTITIGETANISASQSVAIYHPQGGTLTINGGIITGGIEAKSGTITINGNPSISAVGEKNHTANGNGPSTTGYAIAIVDNSAYDDGATITINGGSYNGPVEYLKDGNGVGTGNESGSITVSGGHFSAPVSQEYLANTINAELYSLRNPETPYSYYPTVEDARTAAQPGDVVTDLSDVDASTTTRYDVVFHHGNGTTQTLSVYDGASITLPTLSNRGYNHFVGWTDQAGKHYNGGDAVKITSDTTFTAQWSYIPPANPNYKITIGAMENGTVTANPTAAKAGATVTLTPVPDEGYALSTLTVTDRFGDAVRVTENSDGTYTFPMPNGQVTVTATFVQVEEPAPTEPFVDVNEGDWFYDAVVYAYQNELMDGVGGNRFAPNSETTRAQLVTILYRLEGEPAVSGDLPFTDVEAGIWYTDAILWAAQNNIVNGVSDTEFAPGDDLTRQQLVTILYRYAEAKGYDVSASADLSGYPDAGQVQDYAQPAMAWAVAENIIQGMEDGTLKPAGNASRAQIATILMRFCEDVAQ